MIIFWKVFISATRIIVGIIYYWETFLLNFGQINSLLQKGPIEFKRSEPD